MLLVVVLLCLSHNTSYGAIGSVTEQKGSASITHNKQAMDAKPRSPVDSNDLVQTGSGVVGITFEDNTQVRVTENSKLLIDDFVYDPNKKGAGKLALKVTMGTVRYASGNIAHENNKNVAINTPTASVAVRGTAFTMTVDEVGKSLIILLPNADGSVGMIDVITATGTVTLNQAFQATMTTSPEVKPTKPVLLLLSESAIDNMLIVKPPREVLKQIVEEVKDKSGAALDFNGLDQNALEVKVWKDPYANFDELSINALDGEYLGNAFDNQLLTAFQVGYNTLTGVYIFDKQSYWQVNRPKNNQNATILINKDKGYTININQNNSQTSLSNQDSSTNIININQKGN
jgi:FecR protein